MARAVQKIVVFGKGGIGKSTVCANLAVVYAQQGLKVLLVGCDPKHDTTLYLTGGKHIPTVLQSPHFQGGVPSRSNLVFEGALGIDCVEAGGPEPGVGCAGRGITRMSELLKAAGVVDDSKYDVILYDVLGDVVCGGFATPLREGFAEKVVIVTSEELMALYAANNIARAVRNTAGRGSALVGLVANVRDADVDTGVIDRFAGLLGTGVLQFIPRDPLVRDAEYRKMTVAELAPNAPIVGLYRQLAAALAEVRADPAKLPTPMTDEAFHELSREKFRSPVAPTQPAVAAAAEPPAAPSPSAVAEPWRRFLIPPSDPRPPRWFEEELLNASAAARRLQSAAGETGFDLVPTRPRCVDLLGLPEGKAAEECAALLESIGISVNARLVPRFDAVEASRFLAATRCVLHARPAFEAAYEHAMDGIELPAVHVPLPYGPTLTRAWLTQIAEPFGSAAAAERAVQQWEAQHRSDWEAGVAAARMLRVAFVVGPEDASVLAAGGGAAGMPIAAVVRELGFAVDVLCVGDSTAVPSGERFAVHRFASVAELEQHLRTGPFHAVYSEFPLDQRIAKGGKAQIGPLLFEPGLDGALRTQARVITACRRRLMAVA